jgi:hypothetical protein
MPGLAEEPPRLGGIVRVIASAVAELVHGHGPVPEGGGNGGIHPAHAIGHGIDELLAIDGVRDGPAHPDIGKGRPVRAHVDLVADVAGVLRRSQGGAMALELLAHRVPVRPVDCPRAFPPEIVLAGQESGQARGVVLVDGDLDAIDVGQPRKEIPGVPDQREADVRSVVLQHPGPGAHGGLGPLQIAELLHALPGDDGQGHGVGDHVEEPGEGFLDAELHSVTVAGLHPVHRSQHVGLRIALHRAEALHRVHDVLGGQLAPIHRWPGLEPHALPELEDVGRLVVPAPRFGQIAFDGEGAGRDGRTGLVLEQAAMREGVGDLRLEGEDEVGIPVRWIPQAQGERAAAFRRLRGRRRRPAAAHGGDGRPVSEKVTPIEHHEPFPLGEVATVSSG